MEPASSSPAPSTQRPEEPPSPDLLSQPSRGPRRKVVEPEPAPEDEAVELEEGAAALFQARSTAVASRQPSPPIAVGEVVVFVKSVYYDSDGTSTAYSNKDSADVFVPRVVHMRNVSAAELTLNLNP